MMARAPPLIWTDFSLRRLQEESVGVLSVNCFPVERLSMSRTHPNA
jgi:hypothetical protein